MDECGRRFHSEVGKFRFLNELIKVVSPKVLIVLCCYSSLAAALCTLTQVMQECDYNTQVSLQKFYTYTVVPHVTNSKLRTILLTLLLQYLGSRTPESVKKKVLEIMYSWTVRLPDENKISDAYQMLKKQGECLTCVINS